MYCICSFVPFDHSFDEKMRSIVIIINIFTQIPFWPQNSCCSKHVGVLINVIIIDDLGVLNLKFVEGSIIDGGQQIYYSRWCVNYSN